MKIKIVFFLLALACLPLCSHAQGKVNSATVYKHLNKGNKLLAAKDSLGAAKAYMEAIKVSPQMADPYEKVGMIYSSYPKYSYQMQAKVHYEQFLVLSKDAAKKAAVKERIKQIDFFLKNAPKEDPDPVQVGLVALSDQTSQTENVPKPQEVLVVPDNVAALSPADSLISPADSVDLFSTVAPPPVKKEVVEMLLMNEVGDMDESSIVEITVEEGVSSNSEDSQTSTAQYVDGTSVEEAAINDPFLAAKRKKENKGKKASFVYKMKNDELREAYRWTETDYEQTRPLYKVLHPVETPLDNELTLQIKTSTPTTTDGRWASTLRNPETMRELFLVNMNSAEKRLDILPESDIILQDNKIGRLGNISNKIVGANSVSYKYEYKFNATSMKEVKGFVCSHIQPYIGKITEDNHNWIAALEEETGAVLPVECILAADFKATPTALHGTLSVNMMIDRDSVRVPVISHKIPCSLYRIDENYNGFNLNTVTMPKSAETDSTYMAIVVELQSKNVKTGNDWNDLGYCYLNGLGVKQNIAKAITYFEDAAKKGSKEAFVNLFTIYYNNWSERKRDYMKAFEQLAAGRDAGSIDAFNISADLMLDARTPDEATAFNWYMKSQQKSAYALYRLGQMSMSGVGTPQSYPAALSRFQSSSALGLCDAQYEIALMTLNGLGGDRSVYEAYKKAVAGAQEGSVKSMQMLAEMYFTGVGAKRNFKRGLQWLRQMKEKEYNTLKGYKHVEK